MLRADTTTPILAREVTFETFMRYFADDYAEWVDGTVIKLSPVTRDHDLLTQFFVQLLRVYLDATSFGLLMVAPFVMRVNPKASAREPDLHIVSAERAAIVQRTMTAGPADVVIEIVSEESIERDRETKFKEYQTGGVREYWLIEADEQQAAFYRLDETGRYQEIEQPNGVFVSSALPSFMLDTHILWRQTLPNSKQIDALVAAMIGEGADENS